jgi:hypothetical protein
MAVCAHGSFVPGMYGILFVFNEKCEKNGNFSGRRTSDIMRPEKGPEKGGFMK